MVENIMIYASKMTRLQEDHAGASVGDFSLVVQTHIHFLLGNP
jgi:hypothetical protein